MSNRSTEDEGTSGDHRLDVEAPSSRENPVYDFTFSNVVVKNISVFVRHFKKQIQSRLKFLNEFCALRQGFSTLLRTAKKAN